MHTREYIAGERDAPYGRQDIRAEPRRSRRGRRRRILRAQRCAPQTANTMR
jgi:hypothetical protein